MPPWQIWLSVVSTASQRARVIEADRATPQQPEHIPLRKLRRTLKAAMRRDQQRAQCAATRSRISASVILKVPVAAAVSLASDATILSALLAHLIRLALIRFRDPQQHRYERRPSIALRLRKIGAAPKRPRLAIEKHGQRPPALLAKPMQRAHVNRVDVGPLLAIDFDVDVKAIHDLGGRLGPRSFRAP